MRYHPRIALCLVLASACCAALSGCNTGPRPPASPGHDPIAGSYPKITTDGALAQYMVVEYTSIAVRPPAEDRPLMVQVPLRSQADNEFAVQYSFTWLDAGGIAVGDSGWRTELLPSRRQKMLTANALSRNAVDWRLDIRSAR